MLAVLRVISFLLLKNTYNACYEQNKYIFFWLTKECCAYDVNLRLMSCRVLKKDMEFAMLDELVRQCKIKGISKIIGIIIKALKTR